MKRILIAIMAGLMLTATTPAQAYRSKRHTTTTTVNNKASNIDKDAHKKDTTTIVAFSDTTDTATVDAVDSAMNIVYNHAMNNNDERILTDILKQAFVPVAVAITMFFLAPVAIIGLIVYLIVKSRKQKIRMAEIAMQSGQPIPKEILNNTKNNIRPSNNILWEKGVLKMFIGAGLIVLFLFIGSDLGVGIGFFVAIYGCGQAFIGYTAKKEQNEKEDKDSNEGGDNATNNANEG